MLAFLAGPAGCSNEVDIGRPWMASLASLTCSEQVGSTLAEWGATDEMFETAPGTGPQVLYRFPTPELGEWLRLETDGLGATVSLVAPHRVESRVFASDCLVTTIDETNRIAADREGQFTDADLRRVVTLAADRGAAGVVVYLWSPHMPLSIDGYSEIATAAATHGLALVPLLLPHSDRAFATVEAKRGGIPDAGLREPASVELTFRDALVHAPSILLFDEERVSAVLPGYRSAAGYREFLEAFTGPS